MGRQNTKKALRLATSKTLGQSQRVGMDDDEFPMPTDLAL
jgi:hypothetical protein